MQPFPLEQPPEKALAGDDSDEEAVEVLEEVLGRLPAGGGGSSGQEEEQLRDGVAGEQGGGGSPPGSGQL